MTIERDEAFGAQLGHCPQLIVVTTMNVERCSRRKLSSESNQICRCFCLPLLCQLAISSTGRLTRRHFLLLHHPHHRLHRLRRPRCRLRRLQRHRRLRRHAW
jgi:hypothetical protein